VPFPTEAGQFVSAHMGYAIRVLQESKCAAYKSIPMNG